MYLRFTIALGAIIGASLRFGITNISESAEIWLTLVVNLSGCFLLGIVLVHGERFLGFIPSLQKHWRPFLATGFLGGFTTTSAFSVQSVSLIQKGQTLNFGALLILSIFGGLLIFNIAQKIALKGLTS